MGDEAVRGGSQDRPLDRKEIQLSEQRKYRKFSAKQKVEILSEKLRAPNARLYFFNRAAFAPRLRQLASEREDVRLVLGERFRLTRPRARAIAWGRSDSLRYPGANGPALRKPAAAWLGGAGPKWRRRGRECGSRVG